MIGELLPDQPALDNPGVLQAKNVLPYGNAYRPVRQMRADTNALAERCRGAAILESLTGVIFNYAGDRTDIYTRSGDTYTSIDTGYSLQERDRWEFARWFNTVIAVNGADPVLTGAFGAALTPATNAPTARHLTVARNIAVVGNTSDDSSEIRWSALGDPTNWDTNEAGAQHLDGAGAVTKIVGGEFLTIFMEGGIYRGTYIGPPATWQFDLVVPNKTVPYSGLNVRIGYNSYFLSQDGFYVFDGAQANPISSEKLSKFFFDDFDREADYLASTEADLENNMIYFAYPGQGHGEESNRIMVYNYVTGIWTGPIEQKTQQLLYGQTPGVLLDDFPGPDVNNLVDTGIYADWLVDDPRFLGGKDPILGAFIPGNFHAAPTGNVLPTLIETGDYQHNPQGYALVTGFRPIVDGTAPIITAAIQYRNETYGPVTSLGKVPINPRTGKVDQRISARYHRYLIEVFGEFDSISGGEPEIMGAAKR